MFQVFGRFQHIPLSQLLVFVFVFLCVNGTSQVSWKGSFSAGYAFNHAIYLDHERVDGAHGATLLGAGMLDIPLTQSFSVAAGLAAKLVFASGSIRLTEYNSRTLRAYVPILLGYQINDRFRVLSGVSIQNNRDFSAFRFKEKYGMRYNLVIQGQYSISKRWYVIQKLEYNVGIPDVYLVNDPRIAISAGFVYHINRRKIQE